MPQGEPFWNPYRMIPMRPPPLERQRPLTDEKFQGQSGLVSCALENLTPLFIGGNRDFKENFLTRNGQCVIPGSSLKGLLRALAEIAGGGCMITDVKGRYNKTYAACNKADKLCIACRMFGMMERGSNARVHKGNVSIGDALLNQEHPNFKDFRYSCPVAELGMNPFIAHRTPDGWTANPANSIFTNPNGQIPFPRCRGTSNHAPGLSMPCFPDTILILMFNFPT